MPKRSDTIEVNAADLKAEIRAIEQSVEAGKARLDESVRRAKDAAEQLERESAAAHGGAGAASCDCAARLEKARRNAARVEQEGKESLDRFRKKADAALNVLRRQLKIVEEKLASRH